MSENQSNVLPFISLEERKTKINEAISNMEPEAQFNLIKKMFPDHDVITTEDGHIAISEEPKVAFVEYTPEQLDYVSVGIVFAMDYFAAEREDGLDVNAFFDNLQDSDYAMVVEEAIEMHKREENE